MNTRWMRNSFIYLLIVVAVIAIFFTLFAEPLNGTSEMSISEVVRLAKLAQIQSIEASGSKLTIVTNSLETYNSRIEDNSTITEILQRAGVDIGTLDIYSKSSSGLGNLLGILLNFLPLIFFGAVLFFMMRQAQGNTSQTFNFGRSRARMFVGSSPTVTFADVAGVEEAKTELEEVVEFLKFPDRFLNLGARIPRGVLLVGPPGTGKTLLARAVAGEAGVPFFSISGSEFVEMFVGVGASRVRDLFDQAKRNAPCIVFVDEIDAVGRHRGAGVGGGHDEREQTLNQILVEMDGFDTSTNVIVVAATNRPDILDPALLRPGRFDRRVTLDNPDIRGRTQILDVHSKGKPIDEKVDLGRVARQTPGFSGADLANLVNESAILAARRKMPVITYDEFAESIDRVMFGPARKSRVISEREKEMTAYHEAGHTVVGHFRPNTDPIAKVTIVSRGHMGGYTKGLPEEDRHLWTKNQFEDQMAMAMGGRLAEELHFGEVTTGASNDLEQATNIARTMVTRYGMSEKLGPRTFGKREELVFLGREISEQRDYSDQIAETIDNEVHQMVDQAYETAKAVLEENEKVLVRLAKYLIENETAEGDILAQLLDPSAEGPPEPPVVRQVPPTAAEEHPSVEEETVEGGEEPPPTPREQPGPA